MYRIGIGTDRHKLAFGKKLILGGVKVESAKGAVGHSDADTLTHAIIDAILGAAGMGDIGHHFPDTDPKWKDADSIMLLAKSVDIITTAGYKVINVDASIHLENPKLKSLKQQMAANIAEALKIPKHFVNIKAKTGEGLDAVGKGEAVDCFATALIESVHTGSSAMLPRV